MVQDRARLVDEIASKWRDICPRLEIDPQQIESRLPRGATPYECANKFVETVWNMNISVSSFYYACRRAEFELAGRVDWIRPIGATGAATSAPYTATVQQVVAHEESKTGSLAANAALAAIDEEDDVPTMRTVFSIPGHKTVALLIAALDTDTCKEVLFQPQETERLRAAFVEIYNTLVTEQRADANYNMAFNMLRMLCQTNKFGAMPVVEFVQTLFAGIKKLQKTVAKIVKEHDETARRQTSSIKAATDKLIDWNNLLLSGDYSLKPNTNPKSVIAALEELGVAKIDDLEHVDVDDLVQCGLNKVSAKKLKKLVDEQTATATATAVTMDDD